MAYPRRDLSRHLVEDDNVALIAPRQTREHVGAFITSTLTNHKSFSGYDKNTVFPLYLYPSDQHRARNGKDMFNDAPDGRRPNLTSDFVEACKSRWGLKFTTHGSGDLDTQFGPDDVLHYAYAILHSPIYRDRYEELLRIGFPRLPITPDVDLLRALCKQGETLLDLHLMSWNPDSSEQPSFPEPGSDKIVSRHPRYIAPGATAPDGEEVEEGRVYINEKQYFKGVEPAVWEFHVGGYQVCEKWLKDRKGQSIDSYDEKQHYKNTVATIRRTIRQMDRIDSIIEDHGGWPLVKPDTNGEANESSGS